MQESIDFKMTKRISYAYPNEIKQIPVQIINKKLNKHIQLMQRASGLFAFVFW